MFTVFFYFLPGAIITAPVSSQSFMGVPKSLMAKRKKVKRKSKFQQV